MTPRRGYTLVEVIASLVIISGVILAMAQFSQRFTRQTTDASVEARASDLAVQQLETVKAWRVYGTLVGTFNGTAVDFAAPSPYAGLRRRTLAVRTGPSATADHVTVTVVVTGAGLPAPVRKTTIIAAF